MKYGTSRPFSAEDRTAKASQILDVNSPTSFPEYRGFLNGPHTIPATWAGFAGQALFVVLPVVRVIATVKVDGVAVEEVITLWVASLLAVIPLLVFVPIGSGGLIVQFVGMLVGAEAVHFQFSKVCD